MSPPLPPPPPHRLALYVYEYLLHIGAQKSAQTFLSEVCEIWRGGEKFNPFLFLIIKLNTWFACACIACSYIQMYLIYTLFFENPHFLDPMGEKHNTRRTPWIPTLLVVVRDNVSLSPCKHVQRFCVCVFFLFTSWLVLSTVFSGTCIALRRRGERHVTTPAKQKPSMITWVALTLGKTAAQIALSSPEEDNKFACQGSGCAMSQNFFFFFLFSLALSEQSPLCLSTLKSWQNLPHSPSRVIQPPYQIPF